MPSGTNVIDNLLSSDETPKTVTFAPADVKNDDAGIPAGLAALYVESTGTVAATWNGAPLEPGDSNNYSTESNETLGAFTYDATAAGAELTFERGTRA